ncbi:MAG: hypothetical protein ACOVO2_12375 [Emticicia sp.]|uniref:hypothetical protein n=1 Tax=Emticicia sp. TaxID=1930953 RepID=UPI003BA8066A
MMKSIFIFLFLVVGIFGELKAQDDEEYYKPPTKRLDVRNNAYPNLNRKEMSLYMGIEGGFKLNYASLDNSINGLVSIQNNNVFAWGVSLGYNYDNKWAVETGYLNNPIFLIQSIATRRRLTTYQIGRNFTTIPLRYKYKVWTLDAITKTAGLYVGGGVLFNTNVKDRLINELTFTGYDYRFSAAGRDSVKLELTSKSFLTKKLSAVFELQTELQGRVANGFYISVFGRMAFAPNAGIRSDLVYTENSNKIGEATQSLNGISYNFGLSLRFDLARGYKYQSKVE